MKQQGFAEEADSVCDMHFSGLYFQPRIMGSLVVVAILLQNPIFYLLFIMMAMMSTSGLMVVSNVGPFANEYKVAEVLVFGLRAREHPQM